MRYILVCLLAWLIGSAALLGQSSRADTLWQQLAQSRSNDSIRTQLYLKLLEDFQALSPNKLLPLGEEVIAFAQEKQNDELLYTANNVMGYGNVRSGNLPAVYQYYQKGLELTQSQEGQIWREREGKSEINLSIFNAISQDIEAALEHGRRAVNILQESGPVAVLADAYHQMSICHLKAGQVDSSAYFFDRSKAIYTEMGDINSLYTIARTQGYLYFKAHEYQLALAYFEQAKSLAYQSERFDPFGINIQFLLPIYLELGKYDQALALLHEALPIIRENQDSNYLMNAYDSGYKIHKALADYDSALFYREQYYQLEKKIIGAETQKKISELKAIQEKKEIEQEAKADKLRSRLFSIS